MKIINKKTGRSLRVIWTTTYIVQNNHSERIGRQLQRTYGIEENVEITNWHTGKVIEKEEVII